MQEIAQLEFKPDFTPNVFIIPLGAYTEDIMLSNGNYVATYQISVLQTTKWQHPPQPQKLQNVPYKTGTYQETISFSKETTVVSVSSHF